MSINWYKYASPASFYFLAGKMIPFFSVAAVIFLVVGLYIGFMSLQAAIDDPRRADKAGAIIALVGVVNIPIIYFSVQWWNTLHQGASVSLTQSPKMATTMLAGMLIMSLAAWMYSIVMVLIRTRVIILERERHTAWVAELKGATR